jgi:hypothetical protein
LHPVLRIAAAGALAVVAFDAAASLASRAAAVSYAWATVGSWLLYAGFGLLAARAAPAAPVRTAALVGAALGLTDATLGWAVSWAIGAGRVSGGLTVGRWLATAVFVTALAAGVAAAGGATGRAGRGSGPAAA